MTPVDEQQLRSMGEKCAQEWINQLGNNDTSWLFDEPVGGDWAYYEEEGYQIDDKDAARVFEGAFRAVIAAYKREHPSKEDISA